MMKTNKKLKIISHIDPHKLRSFLAEEFPAEYSFGMITTFEVRDFSELSKHERRRLSRQINRENAKTAIYHKEYFRYIYLILKSIF